MLDTRMVQLSHHPEDHLSARDLLSHTICMGASGAGKTSSTLAIMLKAMAAQGWGGLIACVKADEYDNVRRHLRVMGRERDIIRVTFAGENTLWRINLLDYVMGQSGQHSRIGRVSELSSLLATLNSFMQHGSQLVEDNDFWSKAANSMGRHALTLLALSGKPLSFDALYAMVSSLPQSLADTEDAYWKQKSDFWKVLKDARDQEQDKAEERALRIAERYFLREYIQMPDRTRGSVQMTLTTLLDAMTYGNLHLLFGTDTTFVPEMSFEGKIIILDMSPYVQGETGRIAQRIVKHLWQQAVLRRRVDDTTRPVFLLMDEAQALVSGQDFNFLSTARSARGACLYSTQNISNFYAAVGAQDRNAVDALLGLFDTKIFHANSDAITNEWAARLIGMQERTDFGVHIDSQGQIGISGSRRPEYVVDPATFTQLQKGGAPHFFSEALIFQNGRRWRASGDVVLPALFPQQLESDPPETMEVEIFDADGNAIVPLNPMTQEEMWEMVGAVFVQMILFIEQILFIRHNPAMLQAHADQHLFPREAGSQSRQPAFVDYVDVPRPVEQVASPRLLLPLYLDDTDHGATHENIS